MALTPQATLEDLISTKSIGALDEYVELPLFGVSGGKAVVSGTWVGTIKFQGLIAGTEEGHVTDRWDAIGTFSGTTGAILSQTGITSNDILVFVGIAGLKKIRAIFTSYTSGSATVTLRGSNGVSNIFGDNLVPANFKTEVYGKTAVGSSPTEIPVSVAAIDFNGVKQPFLLDETGSLITSEMPKAQAAQSKVFVVTTNNLTVGTAETPLFLLRNPSGSGKTVKIFKLKTTGRGTFRIYHLPTVTGNGTALVPQNRRVVSGSQGNSALVTHTPTVTSNGSLAELRVTTTEMGTDEVPFESYIILPQNTSILITAAMIQNNTTTNMALEWVEL